jgi:hypothetical protein
MQSKKAIDTEHCPQDLQEKLQGLQEKLQDILFSGITSPLSGGVGNVRCIHDKNNESLIKIVITPEANCWLNSRVRGTTLPRLKERLKEFAFEENNDKNLEATVNIESMRDFIRTHNTCCHLL